MRDEARVETQATYSLCLSGLRVVVRDLQPLFALMCRIKAFMPPQGFLLTPSCLPSTRDVKFFDENVTRAHDEDFAWADAIFGRRRVDGKGGRIGLIQPSWGRPLFTKGQRMTKVVYHIVEHDGGWAYQAMGVFSETFASHDSARAAALRVAREQRISGEMAAISWEDSAGKWHEELVRGPDRPETEVDS